MHRLLPLLLLLCAALALAGCTRSQRSSTPPAPGGKVTLLFSADIWGQLEPCGCSADMRGGLDRMATLVKNQRAQGPTLFIDAGDAYFDATSYDERMEDQAHRRAQAVAQALRAMRVDAKARFERDEVLPLEGIDSSKRLGAPKVLEAGGVRVGLIAVDGLAGQAPAELPQGVRAAREAGAQVVAAIIHGPRQMVLELALPASTAGADFVVGSHIDTIEEGEKARMIEAQIPVFFTQARGQSLLAIEVVLRGEGPLQLAGNQAEREREIAALEDRITSLEGRLQKLPEGTDPTPFREKVRELQVRRTQVADAEVAPPPTGNYLAWRFVPVTEERAADPEVRQVLAAYDRDVAQANLARARANPVPCPEAAPGEASFVGNDTCAACHGPALAFWKTTGHARAWETLVEIEKQYDLACISCHVTGWERPGGVCDVAHTEGRVDVGCESCHGPGSLHVQNPTQARLPAQVPERTCLSCHTPENSSAFHYETYRDRIVGPGHGAPAK